MQKKILAPLTGELDADLIKARLAREERERFQDELKKQTSPGYKKPKSGTMSEMIEPTIPSLDRRKITE